MTLNEFLAKLQTEPWQFQYISNVLSQNQDALLKYAVSRPIGGVFTWGSTPEGWDFWDDVDRQYPSARGFTTEELINSIRTIYSKTHPELFI